MLFLIFLQVILIWTVVYAVFRVLYKRDEIVPIDDIGIWWLSVFMLYTTLPPTAWLVQGGSYSELNVRLYNLQPTPHEVFYLLNVSILYIFSFASVYLLITSKLSPPFRNRQVFINSKLLSGAIIVLLFSISIRFGLSYFGVIREAESYADSYAALGEVPLVVRQFIKIIMQVSGVATYVFVIGLFQRWPKYRSVIFLFILVVFFSVDLNGSRGYLVTTVLSLVIAWHILVREISVKRVVLGGLLGLIIFLFLGIYRQITALNELGSIGFQGFGLGEFDALWGNSVELLQAKNSDMIYVSNEIRFGEFVSFIPSQLLWFEKVSLNNWYLDAFYPGLRETGMGFVFGALAQSVFGGGLIEALIRGTSLGLISGVLMVIFRGSKRSWWFFPLQIYLLVGIFAGIRETTFIQFGDFVQTWVFAPVIIIFFGDLYQRMVTKNRDVRREVL